MTFPDDIALRPNNRATTLITDTFKPGELIGGKYRVLETLGQGGMGCVYKVLQVFLNRHYALKTLNLSNVSDTNLRRFQAEAKLASTMVHPGLVQVHDFGLLHDGIPYLVMDFVEGISLADFLKKNGTLSEEVAVKIFIQACLALFYAHNSGVVHRDLKPSNIMLATSLPLGAEGSVRIVDFGIAKLLHRDEGEVQALTKTGEIFGSPLYMSPEQCSGGIVDHRADIYSMGCVLFEMLTGTPPHFGMNAMTTMISHIAEEAPALKQASLGKEFGQIVEQATAKMLKKRADQRYNNLGEVVSDLAGSTAGSSTTKVLPARREKNRNDIISMRKVHFWTLLCAATSMTALVTACAAWYLLSSRHVMSQSKPEQTEVYSPELNVARKVVSDHIDEGDISLAELRAKIERPMADGKIRFRGINFNRTALAEIANSTKITTLDIIGCGVDNSSIDLLQSMPELIAVTATKTNLNDRGTAGLLKCKHLIHLKLSRTPIGDLGVHHLSKIDTLESLDVSSTKITEFGLREICRLRNLKDLNISSNDESIKNGLKHLCSTGIEKLICDDLNLEDQSLGDISKMLKLQTLSICGSQVTAAGIETLVSKSRIKLLYLAGCPKLTTADLDRLAKAHPTIQLLTSRANDVVGFEMLLDNSHQKQ